MMPLLFADDFEPQTRDWLPIGELALAIAFFCKLAVLTLDQWKSIVEILSSFAGVFALFLAVKTYQGNAERERAKWAVQLYEKFYEGDKYKAIRDRLNSTSDSADVEELVGQ